MSKPLIARAFQLALSCRMIEDIRLALRREGYSNVDAHLTGRVIRADLGKLLHRQDSRSD